MLPGVLLHVVEPARPVDDSTNRLSDPRRRSFDNVHDLAVLIVNHVDDARRTERACVEWLTACGWIESRAIEIDGMTSGAVCRRIWLDADHSRIEFAFIRVVVIEALGHEIRGATRQKIL